MEEQENEAKKTAKVTKDPKGFSLSGMIGLLCTIAYLALIILSRRNDLPKLCTMPLNEVGDFLAGAFGPVAFLWLVLGYFQQQKELSLNTKALKEQGRELRDSVKEQEKLVKASHQQIEQQAELLKLEQQREIDELRPSVDLRLSYDDAERFRLRFVIFNKGTQPAKNFKIQSNPEINIAIDGSKGMLLLPKEEHHLLGVLPKKTTSLPREIKIKISFENIQGHTYQQFFYFSLFLHEDEEYRKLELAEDPFQDEKQPPIL